MRGRVVRTKNSIEQCRNTIKPNHHGTPTPLPTRFSSVMNSRASLRAKSCVRDLLDWRKDVDRLQEVSDETEKTSKADTGRGEGLSGTRCWDHAGRWLNGSADGSSGGRGCDWSGGWDSGGGCVAVDWGGGWDNTIVSN